MNESLRDFAFFTVLSVWPRYFDAHLVEQKVEREFRRIKRLLVDYKKSSTGQGTDTTLPCSSEGSSTYSIPINTQSYPGSSGDAPLSGSKKCRKKDKLPERNKMPKHREARMQKRKVTFEEEPNKKCRHAPERTVYTAADTSSFDRAPLPHRVIPKYLFQYTQVLSLEQRNQYFGDYLAAKDEYDYLHARIGETLQHFKNRTEQCRMMVPESELYQMASALICYEYSDVLERYPSYPIDSIRLFYLQSKLAHLQRLIEEFDRWFGHDLY